MLTKFLRAAAGNKKIQYVGGSVQTFAGTANNISVSLTSLTGGIASAPAAGDFVLIYFATGSTVDRNLVVSGYTEIIELYSNDDVDTNFVAAYKFMPTTPDTSITLTGGTLDSFDAGAVVVHVFRGVNPVTPLDVTSTTATGTSSSRANPAAITPVTTGAFIVVGGASGHPQSSGIYSSSDLTSFLTAFQSDTNRVTIGAGYKIWENGSFDPSDFSFSNVNSNSASWAAITVALRPA